MLIQTNYGVVHKALFTSNIFTSCFDLMFALPKSSIVHSGVKEVICDLLYCENSEWTIDWIKKFNVLDRLCEQAVVEETSGTKAS